MKLGLYKFYWDCGRNGDIEGLFAAYDKEIERLIGKEIYLGEVLGKHSEVSGVVESDDITLLSEDEKLLEVIIDNDISCGYCPTDYLGDEWFFDTYEEYTEYEKWFKSKGYDYTEILDFEKLIEYEASLGEKA